MSGTNSETKTKTKSPWLPPRWFIHLAWQTHRKLYKWTGGRRGIWHPRPGKYGVLALKTIGRRSGQERKVMVAYYDDGPNLVTMAMNGWGEAEPAWWLNLQANPDVEVELKGETRLVRGRAAEGEERDRLWARWQDFDKNLDAYATRRPQQTAVVVLEPRSA